MSFGGMARRPPPDISVQALLDYGDIYSTEYATQFSRLNLRC